MVKFSKKSLITAVSVLVSVLMLFTACQLSKTDEGTGNLNSRGVATTIGNELYYKHPFNYQLYKTDLKSEETAKVG